MSGLLPVAILLTSLSPALATFFVKQESTRLRNALNLGGAALKLQLIVVLLAAVAGGAVYEARMNLAPGLYVLLRVNALALLFMTLSAVLWFLTTIYGIAYFGQKAELSRGLG